MEWSSPPESAVLPEHAAYPVSRPALTIIATWH